ncbi:hypothetical protein ACJ2A9_16930 [Anaerobacillus sp. MEB173]|uniref:hypothetical protein n=1 Tax=Anaerobacillus sp. MEB173 TaxID=3383345 RepID=UPI003F91748B
MVITIEMPVSGIANSWDKTIEVFNKYDIPVGSNKALKEHLQDKELDLLISDLNKSIGSSEVTCIEGG